MDGGAGGGSDLPFAARQRRFRERVGLTQEELAGMVGASRERVNKAIASFIRLGWLEQRDRQYSIIQRDRLELRAR